MKRIYIAIIALAAACTPATIDNRTPQGGPSDEPSAEASADPSASPAAFDPTGCVKTVTKEFWTGGRTSYMWMKDVITITYDDQGRPKQEATVEYSYDESGELLPDGFGELKRNSYYFFDGNSLEIRQHPEEEAVIYKAELGSNGCVIHYETGYMRDGKWNVDSSVDCAYNPGPYLCERNPVKGPNVASRQPWLYYWSKEGDLTEARQQWETRPAEVTDDETKYYIYGNTSNVTLGAPYDILGLVMDGLDPYGLMGKCPAKVPESANSTYRNEVLSFDWSFSREGPCEKVTVTYRPFVDEGDGWSSVESKYVYSFTYYE